VLVSRVALIIMLLEACGVWWCLEQPSGSLMEAHPRMREVLHMLTVHRQRLMCMRRRYTRLRSMPKRVPGRPEIRGKGEGGREAAGEGGTGSTPCRAHTHARTKEHPSGSRASGPGAPSLLGCTATVPCTSHAWPAAAGLKPRRAGSWFVGTSTKGGSRRSWA
jgi:hypothetical protein